MDKIENVVIVGMGALGLLFGQQIQNKLGADHLCYLMDKQRKERHLHDRYTINGNEVSFRLASPDDLSAPADLIMISTKFSGLFDARALIRPAVSDNTTIISLMNGISSEEILAEVYPRRQILDCVAIGMDAVRDGTSLVYDHMGGWQIGSAIPGQEEHLQRLTSFLDRAEIWYEVHQNIRHAMWNKFMINVGVNQTCMIYKTDYEGATSPGPALDDMRAAMEEVILVAAAEGVTLSQEDLEKDLSILRSLNPRGIPSMRQDALAGRKTEVELFSGTMLRLAKKHGLSLPVNERYYQTILAMESTS
ncbi:MAG: ketopantoate reductase family protein [Oscillospiraceae bacterium]|nr:ketopantoate reductase family protein [Oscillospiraceae bacterium]